MIYTECQELNRCFQRKIMKSFLPYTFMIIVWYLSIASSLHALVIRLCQIIFKSQQADVSS